MTDAPTAERERLLFLTRVVEREAAYLGDTDRRLFDLPMTAERAAGLAADAALAERVDAFVSRFTRLQDTVGDKLLPALLRGLRERPAPLIDNLNAAERQSWIDDVSNWTRLRRLRNLMVHEYVEDSAVLADALNAAHDGVDSLLAAAAAICGEVKRRLSISVGGVGRTSASALPTTVGQLAWAPMIAKPTAG